MKKRQWIGMLAVLLILTISVIGCGRGDADESSTVKKEEQNHTREDEAKQAEEKKQDVESTKQESQDSKEDGKSAQPDINADPSQDEVRIIVFHGNEDATAFVKEESLIPALSPDAILEALVDKGVVPADIGVLDFETTEVDGKNSIKIDFNNAFSTYIKNMGSTGEYYVIGGVCNTYLSAYNCQQIKITVEGSELTTGHAEYPGYMTMFE